MGSAVGTPIGRTASRAVHAMQAWRAGPKPALDQALITPQGRSLLEDDEIPDLEPIAD